MTLKELLMIIIRGWKLVIVLPVVCALACGAWIAVRHDEATQKATARIIVNSQTAFVAGIAASEARQVRASDPTLNVVTLADDNTMTISINVSGPDIEACATEADGIADRVVAISKQFFAETAVKQDMLPFAAQVEYFDLAGYEPALGGLAARWKDLVVAFGGGLLVAVVILVLIDLRRRPVKTPEGVQKATDLVVLEVLPAKSGERLLANVRFAVKDDSIGSVLVVPVCSQEPAEESCDLLLAAAAAEGSGDFSVECGRPLSESMDAAYASRNAGAVVVVAKQWADSLSQLESTVAELRLADAKLAGIVFAQSTKKTTP